MRTSPQSDMSDFVRKQKAINEYGDRPIRLSESFGTDISSIRLDDLDKRYFGHVLSAQEKPVCVDLGCGLARPSIAAATIGGVVTLYDSLELKDRFEFLSETIPLPNLAFRKVDLSDCAPDVFPDNIDIIYSQRTLHYLTYGQVLELIRMLCERAVSGARLYLSVSGLRSELGVGYGGASLPVEERHHTLGQEMAEKHDILQPICLYTEEDMERLGKDAGLLAIDVYSSSFGNIKAILEKE